MNDHSLLMKMINKNTQKVFEYLVRNPTTKPNINHLARALKISLGSTFNILKEYEKKQVLKSEKLANSIFYQCNYTNKETRKICELLLILMKNKILQKNPIASVYADELSKLKVKAIVLFGSILTKKEKAKDVDVLFIINRNDVKKVSDFCIEVSKTKTKPIVPLILTKNDIINRLKQKNKIIEEIFRTGVVLSGEETIISVFGEL